VSGEPRRPGRRSRVVLDAEQAGEASQIVAAGGGVQGIGWGGGVRWGCAEEEWGLGLVGLIRMGIN
jgi:hypothetical protein